MLSPLLLLLAANAAADEPPVRRSRGFALVELYTSEGCSSCPPADVLLSDLVKESAGDDVAIYALAFHVPWWDNAAWKDRFSTEANGARQRSYGDQFGLQTIYTPQVVVNGRVEFVGSSATSLRSAVARGLATPAAATLSLSAESAEDSVTVSVSTQGVLTGSQIVVAVVENGLASRVMGGENRGKGLHHDGVVRAMANTEAKPEVQLTVALPSDLTPTNASVIVWLQASDLAVLGAADIPLPQGE